MTLIANVYTIRIQYAVGIYEYVGSLYTKGTHSLASSGEKSPAFLDWKRENESRKKKKRNVYSLLSSFIYAYRTLTEDRKEEKKPRQANRLPLRVYEEKMKMKKTQKTHLCTPKTTANRIIIKKFNTLFSEYGIRISFFLSLLVYRWKKRGKNRKKKKKTQAAGGYNFVTTQWSKKIKILLLLLFRKWRKHPTCFLKISTTY